MSKIEINNTRIKDRQQTGEVLYGVIIEYEDPTHIYMGIERDHHQ